jgi:peptidoglycan/LPS O-acetylase OafA/YrhL
MIQRIQTVYIIIAIFLVASPLLGLEIMSYSFKEENVSMNVYSLKFINDNKTEPSVFYLINIFLSLFGVYVLFSYKKLKKQLSLSRIYTGLILFTSLMPIIFVIGRTNVFPGLGFYFFLCSLIFVIFASRSIKKDKKLLDSLNRLR